MKRLWFLAKLGVMLVVVCLGWAAAASADEQATLRISREKAGRLISQQRAREQSYLKNALAWLDRNKAVKARVLGQSGKLSAKPVVARITLRDGSKKGVMFDSPYAAVLDLGFAVSKGFRAKNLVKVYGKLCAIVPQQYLAEYPSAAQFSELSTTGMKNIIKRLGSSLSNNVDSVLAGMTAVTTPVPDFNFIGDHLVCGALCRGRHPACGALRCAFLALFP